MMAHLQQSIGLDQPLQYRIEVQGRLNPKWSTFFDGLVITTEKVPDGLAVTILSGVVADQAALHGILNTIRDLGLPLLLVQVIDTVSR